MRMKQCVGLCLVFLLIAAVGCDESPTSPSPVGLTTASVRIVFQGSTTRRPDLPSSAQACADAVGVTHLHPSWRSFAAIPLTPAPPATYSLTLDDVPVNTRVSFRINDQNFCDNNPTGAVTANVLANDVRLLQNATTPGNGDEPGFAFSVAPSGLITQ